MDSSPAGTPDLARHLDDQVRTQERQLLVVRLAVVVLGIVFLVVFGEPISGRIELIGLLGGVALYSLLIRLLLRIAPPRLVAILGVCLDFLAVTGVVWLATNVTDAYLFYALVILGTAIRFGMVPSILSSVVMSATYLGIVGLVGREPEADLRVVVPVRMLFLVMFGVVAGLFSHIIGARAAENARLQERLDAEQLERERARERELLGRLGRDFGRSLELEATQRAIVAGAATLLGDATLLLDLEVAERRLVPLAADAPLPELAERWRAWAEAHPVALGSGTVGIAAESIRQRLGRAGEEQAASDGLDALGFDWILATPILAGGRLHGVLATAGVPGRECDDRMRRVAEALADRAGPALQNAQLWSDLQDRVLLEQQAQRIKDDFLSVVSHELRTPLTSIQGYSQLLEARVRADRATSKEMTHIRIILSQVMRMRRLVDDLLDVSRMDRRGGVSIEPVDFDLGELLREAVGRARRDAPERQMSLTAPESVAVHLDRERMDQVLGNLLENAVKYSPDGGPIDVVAVEGGDEIEVRVTDTGIGIPPEHREHVFERFYQADDEHRGRRFGGLGLGLAISRAIVEAHGGEIWAAANDTAGAGSIFAFRLPLVARAVEGPPLADEDEAPSFVRRSAS